MGATRGHSSQLAQGDLGARVYRNPLGAQYHRGCLGGWVCKSLSGTWGHRTSLGPLESTGTGVSWEAGCAGAWCQGHQLRPREPPGHTTVAWGCWSQHTPGWDGAWYPGNLLEAYISSSSVKKNKQVNHGKQSPDPTDVCVSVVFHSLVNTE